MTLVFLHDRRDLEAVEAERPEILDATVVALDVEVHLDLVERGVAHVTPFSFIRPDERPCLERLEAGLQDLWATSAIAWYRDIDLLGLARFRHIAAWRRIAWFAYVVRRALETFAPNSVVVFPERIGHGLEQPTAEPAAPLLGLLAARLAAEAGIEVTTIDRRASFVDLAAQSTRASADGASWEHPTVPWILFYANGEDLLRQRSLIDTLRRETPWSVVQVGAAYSPEIVRRLRESGHVVLHESRIVTRRAIGIPGIATRARQQWQAALAVAEGELRVIGEAVSLHEAFIFGPYLEAMASHVDAWSGLAEHSPPAAVVTTSPTPMSEILAQRGVATLHLGHAVTMLNYPEIFATLPAGDVGAVTPSHRDRLIAAGLPSKRVHVTGIDLDLHSAYRPDEIAAVDGGGLRILLVTNTIAMPATASVLPVGDWAKATATAGDLIGLFRRRTAWRFSLRHHPRYDHPRAYLGAPASLSRDYSDSIEEACRSADVVVLIDTIGSALVEASRWGRPVFLLDTALQWVDHDAWGTDGWPRVGSIDALEQLLDQLDGDPRRVRELADRTAAACRGYLGDVESPVEMMLETLRKMLRHGSAGCLHAGNQGVTTDAGC